MKVQDTRFLSIEQISEQYLNNTKQTTDKPIVNTKSFEQILKEKATENTEVHFSKHAANRLADRNITLTSDQLTRLNEGTRKADAKGINDSLVIVDQLAFIVNTKNNTVVTAMNQADAGEHVFTNIDGAVFA